MIGGDVEDKWRRLKEIAMFLIFHILFIGNNYLKSSEPVFPDGVVVLERFFRSYYLY